MSDDFSEWSRPELRIRYWDADFNEITRNEAIQRAGDDV